MTIVSISLPDELLKLLDKAVKLRGYASRSELIRELIREHLESERNLDPSDKVTSIIIIMTDHDESLTVDEKVVRIIHNYQPLIRAFYHQLLTDNLCLNIAIVEGEIGVLAGLTKSLRSLKGVKRVWSIITSAKN